MIPEMDFADHASLDRSPASDTKERSHALTPEVSGPFKGRSLHLVAEAHPVPAWERPGADRPLAGGHLGEQTLPDLPGLFPCLGDRA